MARSITVGVRLDPKLRYLTELAARKQRRSLSSFIEWVLEESLARVVLWEKGGAISLADEAAHLWHVDEPTRFARLALRYPDLLTFEEQALWRLIRDNRYVWRGKYWQVQEGGLNFQRLAEHWGAFVAVARGQASKNKLPKLDNSP